MNKLRFFLFFTLVVTLFSACNDNKSDLNKVSPVHWDRDMCERCKMVVSDRKNSVQIKDPKGNVYMFDDIGCALLWFEENHIKWQDKAHIFVTDVQTGKWIDATKAWYDTGNVTPMDFGYSAHEHRSDIKKGKEIIDFNEMKRRILKTEQ